MNEFVSKIAKDVGIEYPLAEKSVGLILDFLKKEANDEVMDQMLSTLPDAEELLKNVDTSGGGLISAIMGGGIMGLGQKLMAQGLEMGQVTELAKSVIETARAYASDEIVDDVVASIPGLNQFV